ncbi:MAG: XRE family transcriptional regulator [Acetobacteraceae bacterium]|nr:XRE family transcriptional regulator [Acetobacteraceae bacterium]
MTVGIPTFHGARLTQARLARGMFKKTLGELIGVSLTQISRYEDGLDKPQLDKLAALSRQLQFPEAFFTTRPWGETLEPIFWRSRTTETKTARNMTEQRMVWLCEVFEFLEREVDFPSVKLPTVNVPDDFRTLTQEAIEGAAETLRAAWKLHNYPIPDVTLALENVGLPVVNMDMMSDKQDGFFFRSRKLGRPFVGINTHNVSASRARFDAAHELGHAVLHRFVTPSQENDPAFLKLLEQQAHRFAAAFLFPREAFIAEVGVPSLDYFAALKKKWGLSIAAMIFRAHDLGMIGDGEKAVLQQGMGRRRWRGPLREPFDNPAEMPLERPRMLRRGFEAAIGDGVPDRRAVLNRLPLPEREVEQLAGLNTGFFNTAAVVRMPPARGGSSLSARDVETGTVIEFSLRRSGA